MIEPPQDSTPPAIYQRLPLWLRKLVDSCPQHGDGVHPWLYSCARQLHVHGTPEEIFALLRLKVARCGEYRPDREITDAIRNSLASPNIS
jgi:hypothetical protein